MSQGLNKPQHIFLRESHRFTRDLPYKHFETHRKLSTSNFWIQLDFFFFRLFLTTFILVRIGLDGGFSKSSLTRKKKQWKITSHSPRKLREKTRSLSFLSDLGSLRIQLSLLAPRSSLLVARDVPSNEERGETAVFAVYDLDGWFCTIDIN